MLRFAERAPIARGVNVTLIVQLPPIATGEVQVFVCVKSVPFVPVKVIAETVRAAVPMLVSVAVCEALGFIYTLFANDRNAGATEPLADPTEVPLRVIT